MKFTELSAFADQSTNDGYDALGRELKPGQLVARIINLSTTSVFSIQRVHHVKPNRKGGATAYFDQGHGYYEPARYSRRLLILEEGNEVASQS